MKRLIASSILTAGALFGMSTEAEAGHTDSNTGWQDRGARVRCTTTDSCGPTGYGQTYRDRGTRGVSHRRIHDHRRVCYERIWVPPCYRSVIVGYTECGSPIYRRVMVHAGYWKTVRRHVH